MNTLNEFLNTIQLFLKDNIYGVIIKVREKDDYYVYYSGLLTFGLDRSSIKVIKKIVSKK